MAKEMSLLEKLYFREEYWQAARIIGYAGIEPFGFWDAAKKLACYNQAKFQRAMYDLTRYDRREASPPRYEFTAPVRKYVFMLLGPAPEDEDWYYRHPDGTPMERPTKKPEKPAEPEPKKKRAAKKKG